MYVRREDHNYFTGEGGRHVLAEQLSLFSDYEPYTDYGIAKAARVVGSMEEAEVAAKIRRTQHEAFSMPFPEGWDVLGQGSFRTAYRAPSGTVYKSANEWYADDQRLEISIFKALADFPWIPAATLWETSEGPVVAMPYLPSKDDEGYPPLTSEGNEMLTLISREYLQDMHSGNYAVVNGKPVVIDAGIPTQKTREALRQLAA